MTLFVLHIQLFAGSPAGLEGCFEYASSHFLELITSIPLLVEAYEGVDANGASARRYMINDPKSRIEPTALEISHHQAPKKPDEPTRIEHIQSQQGRGHGEDAPPSPEEQAVASESKNSGGEHSARDIAYMERRYRSAFASTSAPSAIGPSSLQRPTNR